MSRGIKLLIFLAFFFVFSTSLVILAVLPAWVTGSLINSPISFEQVYQAEEFGVVAEEINLQTKDGIRLKAWEVPAAKPKAAIIFLGGLNHPSVTAFWGHAEVLQQEGYASLLVEMRGRGESSGDQLGLGYLEHLDVLAAFQYLKKQADYAQVPVLVFGVDMGGATAINAAGLYPEIAGLISVGAFSSWSDLFADNLYFSGAPLFLAMLEKPFTKLYTLIKFGWGARRIVPIRQIANLGNRPALIIHSKEDQQVSVLNGERLEQFAPTQVRFWYREGEEHLVATDFLHPRQDPEYLAAILQFLQLNFP